MTDRFLREMREYNDRKKKFVKRSLVEQERDALRQVNVQAFPGTEHLIREFARDIREITLKEATLKAELAFESQNEAPHA